MSPHPVPATSSGPEAHRGWKTGDEMDEERQQNVAYQYLCHLEEAKNWISACIGEELPQTTDLEEGLRNGVYLAKLAHFFAPDIVPLKKIFDPDFVKFHETGLHFRHTDNINYFLQALRYVGLPDVFLPETTDVYDRKNMPRVIFCIHALSLFLFKLGISPQIQDLYGKVTFSDEEMAAMRSALEAYGLPMPQFRKIGGILANEMPVDEAALHAAIIAINDALDKDSIKATLAALQNPNACLEGVDPSCAEKYHLVLQTQKREKMKNARERTLDDSYIPDVYDEMLSQSEIQGHLANVGMLVALERVEDAVLANDCPKLLVALKTRALNLRTVIKTSKVEVYMSELQRAYDGSGEVFLRSEDIDKIINDANRSDSQQERMCRAVAAVNAALENGDPMKTVKCLQDPAFGSLHVVPAAAALYHNELSYVKFGSGIDLRYDGIVGLCGESLNLLSTSTSNILGYCRFLEHGG
jgi:Ras GTPase-activating-like protein IQGAP1